MMSWASRVKQGNDTKNISIKKWTFYLLLRGSPTTPRSLQCKLVPSISLSVGLGIGLGQYDLTMSSNSHFIYHKSM